jgi:hypothetical protein
MASKATLKCSRPYCELKVSWKKEKTGVYSITPPSGGSFQFQSLLKHNLDCFLIGQGVSIKCRFLEKSEEDEDKYMFKEVGEITQEEEEELEQGKQEEEERGKRQKELEAILEKAGEEHLEKLKREEVKREEEQQKERPKPEQLHQVLDKYSEILKLRMQHLEVLLLKLKSNPKDSDIDEAMEFLHKNK